jgi:purine-nucleoside phosphorylase
MHADDVHVMQEKMTNPLITPRTLRRNYVSPHELNECDSAIIGFLTFPAEIEGNLHQLKGKIVSLHDDRRQFYGEFQGKKVIILDRVFGGGVIASVIEELVELHDVKRIIGIGLKLGDFVLASSAVNSGGVAREYYPDQELFLANKIMTSDYKTMVGSINIPFLSACAWTTEAIYREYPAKLQN